MANKESNYFNEDESPQEQTGWENMDPTEEGPSIAERIFNNAMAEAPDGVDPSEFAKSPDCFRAMIEAADAEINDGASKEDVLEMVMDLIDDHLDRDGEIPDDLDEIIFGLDEEDEATAYMHQSRPELMKRMQEHRLERIPGEMDSKIAEIQAKIQTANDPSISPLDRTAQMPFYSMNTFLHKYASIAEKSGGRLDIEPLAAAVDEKIVPELLPQYTYTQNAQENYQMLEVIARECPGALADHHEPAAEAAKITIHREHDPNGYDAFKHFVEDFVYSKDHQGEQVYDDEGQFTHAFQEDTYRQARPDTFLGQDVSYLKAMSDTYEEIIGPERTEMLKFVAQHAPKKYERGMAIMADSIMRSKDPEQAKRNLEKLSATEKWEKISSRLAVIAMRELEINPDLPPDKAVDYTKEVYDECYELLGLVDNDEHSYDMMQNIGEIADAFPVEVDKRYDARTNYLEYFKPMLREKHVLTDEEKKALYDNMFRINSLSHRYDIPIAFTIDIQDALFARGKFTEAMDEQAAAKFDGNLDVIAGLFDKEKPNPEARSLIGCKLATLDLFDRELYSAATQKNIESLTESTAGLTDNAARELFVNFVTDEQEFTEKEIAPESVRGISSIIQRIQESNSLELRRLTVPLTRELIASSSRQETEDRIAYDTAAAERKLDEIENVFLQNNLPTLAKNLLVFNTLHPMGSFRGDFIEGRESRVSPILQRASERDPRNAYIVILRDLVKSGVESNSRELRQYLENLQAGQSIMDRIGSGETTFDELEPDEQARVRAFVNNLAAGHNQTIAGRKEVQAMQAQGGVHGEEDIPEGADWLYHDMPITADTVARINRAFAITSRHNASDRLVRQFGFYNGFENVQGMLNAMDQVRDAADARNRATTRAPLMIKAGDLIKNVSGKYLDDMLEQGTNCKEFLGASADSDATPLDADLTLVGAEADVKSCSEIHSNPNGNYGYVWYVIHNTPDRFATTRKLDDQPGGKVETPSLRDQRMELFRTGAVSDTHYGIRTGIGSTNIDAMVIDTAREFVDKTAFRIVKNGFYIPVYDLEGNLVFAPEDYDALRAKLSGNHEYQTGEYRKASAADFEADAARTAEIDVDVESNAAEVKRKDDAIRAALAKKLEGTGLQFRDHIDDDLTPGFIEISNTGSTGRGTNVPGDGDFDYIFRVDQSIIADPGRFATLSGQLRNAIIMDQHSEQRPGRRPEDIRTKHVHVDGMDDEVDVDITFVPRTDKVTYATEDSIKDYLSNFEGEERAQVVKNIIAAKKLFKAHECYKPRHAGGEDEEGKKLAQGGLGGVGVENWILQNGGSLTAAARSFLEAAGVYGQPDAKPISLTDFIKRYPIWDLGANHMAEENGRYPHDNFSANNLDEGGYFRIIGALQELLGEN